MPAKDWMIGLKSRLHRAIGLPPLYPSFDDALVTIDQARPESADGALTDLFFAQQGRRVHKWVHYLGIYERYLKGYRGSDIKMLEIGVNKGGSLDLWRDYFGPSAKIFGIDIDPECANHVTAPNQVRIGSQDDPAFLKRVVEELGAPDIILDDGSHIGRHQRASFDVLFPLLKDNGLYIIEDMHSAYWHGLYEGGFRCKGTAIEHVKEMIDDMHAWYHNHATVSPARDRIGAIHVHDSITIIEKVSAKPRPTRVMVPN